MCRSEPAPWHRHGFRTTLMQPSFLSQKVLWSPRPCSSVARVSDPAALARGRSCTIVLPSGNEVPRRGAKGVHENGPISTNPDLKMSDLPWKIAVTLLPRDNARMYRKKSQFINLGNFPLNLDRSNRKSGADSLNWRFLRKFPAKRHLSEKSGWRPVRI